MPRTHRHLVSERAGGRCEYCRIPQVLDLLPFQIDHIRSEKHHGTTVLANLAWTCFYCNSYKGPNVAGFDPDTQGIERLFNPRTDKWDDHFCWDAGVLHGKSSIGKTTIDVLRINDEIRVEFRLTLMRAGLFLA